MFQLVQLAAVDAEKGVIRQQTAKGAHFPGLEANTFHKKQLFRRSEYFPVMVTNGYQKRQVNLFEI